MANEHLREVGPHVHSWQTAARIGSTTFKFCQICGARTVDGLMVGANSGQDPWLKGGDWLGDKPQGFREPELIDLGQDEAAMRQAMQGAALGSVGRPRAVPEEITKARAGEGHGGGASRLSGAAEEQRKEQQTSKSKSQG